MFLRGQKFLEKTWDILYPRWNIFDTFLKFGVVSSMNSFNVVFETNWKSIDSKLRVFARSINKDRAPFSVYKRMRDSLFP